MSDTRLREDERLKSRKQLSALFAEGKSLRVFPIRFIWMSGTQGGTYPVRVAFNASKKHWKRAVDRNLLKRRMREAYRFQKGILYSAVTHSDTQILLACLYTAESILPFEQIKRAMTKGLERIASQLSE
jgi:ribonuclease P protein component